MTTIEILLAIISPTVMVAFFIINMIQRLARLETKTDFVLTWIAALNGEMSDKKEFKNFLKELKEVVHEKGL
jgi:hypothetical protein